MAHPLHYRPGVSTTVGEYILRRLHAWGVNRIYGYPGDGVNGIIAAFRHVPEVQLIQVRHDMIRQAFADVIDGLRPHRRH